jgi:hypothetical protein
MLEVELLKCDARREKRALTFAGPSVHEQSTNHVKAAHTTHCMTLHSLSCLNT